MENVLLIGGGGHAKSVLDFLRHSQEFKVVGIIEKDETRLEREILGVPVIGTDAQLPLFLQKEIKNCLISVGGTGDNSLRKRLFIFLRDLGFAFINAVHPTAVVSEFARYGAGNVFMAGAIIGPDVKIGDNTIINSGAVVEHDCRIGDHVHVAPGAKISGNVSIGANSHIGSGAVIIQNIKIGRNVLVGAGSVIINDIPDNAVVVGVPGRVKKYKQRAD